MQTKQERLELIRQVHARVLARQEEVLMSEPEALDEVEELDELREFRVSENFNSDYFSIDSMEV